MSEENNRPNGIAAIILAGGQGSRLGGADKGLLQYKGKPLINWVVDSIKPQVEEIVISINRNENQYKQLGTATIFDDQRNIDKITHDGPIAGILSCAKKEFIDKYKAVLVASCDSPNLNKDYVSRLIYALEDTDAEVAIVYDGVRNQNLHCLIKTPAIESLEQFYQQGGRAMHRWLQRVNLIQVDFSDEAESFINLNSLDDLRTQNK